jgi:hypothetical protein
MSPQSKIFNDRFWKILRELEATTTPISLKNWAFEHELDDVGPSEISEVISFLANFDYRIRFEEGMLYPPTNSKRIEFSLSLSEWLALQAHFPLLEQFSGQSVHETLVNKLAELEEEYRAFDLFATLKHEEEKQTVIQRMQGEGSGIIEKIEASLKDGLILRASLKENRSASVFPHRLVYLEGTLSIVGEDAHDRTLISLEVDKIEDILLEKYSDYIPNFSAREVDDFIYAIRAIVGSEERLVLKVKNAERIDLSPRYHFLGNPYMTTNFNGEMIWAASVEMTNDLFDWLYEIKDDVEILDPEEIREQFKSYAKSKDAAAYKKAS